MRVAVVGGTGTLGAAVVAELERRGHQAVALSRRPPTGGRGAHERVDLATGEGLETALKGMDAVVDASNANRSRRAMQAVLLDGTRRLLHAESAAGIGHHVLISIVGIEDVPIGYYRVKLEQERLVAGSEVPTSVLRATQVHELLDKVFTIAARGGVLPGGRIPLQPVDAHEVAIELVDVVEAGPQSERRQFAGPDVVPLAALARTWRTMRRRHRLVLPVPAPGGIGRALLAGRLTAPDARRGTLGFAAWLAANGPSSHSPSGWREK
jgi:uncharacterized protein YbjT (DUF2867 family)